MKTTNTRILISFLLCVVLLAGLCSCQPVSKIEGNCYDLLDAGVYIAEENETKKIYAVQVEPDYIEKDGIRIDLKNFYAIDRRFYGEVFVTGELLVYDEKEENQIDTFELLAEKYEMTWYFGEEERTMIDGNTGGNSKHFDDGKRVVTEYHLDCEEYLYLEDRGIDTYYLQMNGFDKKFELKVSEAKPITAADEIGVAQMLQGNTIAARATAKNDIIELEYYRFLSDEANPLYKDNVFPEYVVIPNHYEQNYNRKVTNKDGEELPILGAESKMNGVALQVNGTAEDFPITLYYSGFSGTSDESYTVSLPIPQGKEVLTEALPTIDFSYGTVEITSVKLSEGVVFEYKLTPKGEDKERQMYAVQSKVGEHTLRGDISWGESIHYGEVSFDVGYTDGKTADVTFYNPTYWIEGEYNIVIEDIAE